MINGGLKLAAMPCSYDETMKCCGFTGCISNLNLQTTAKSFLNTDRFAFSFVSIFKTTEKIIIESHWCK